MAGHPREHQLRVVLVAIAQRQGQVVDAVERIGSVVEALKTHHPAAGGQAVEPVEALLSRRARQVDGLVHLVGEGTGGRHILALVAHGALKHDVSLGIDPVVQFIDYLPLAASLGALKLRGVDDA